MTHYIQYGFLAPMIFFLSGNLVFAVNNSDEKEWVMVEHAELQKRYGDKCPKTLDFEQAQGIAKGWQVEQFLFFPTTGKYDAPIYKGKLFEFVANLTEGFVDGTKLYCTYQYRGGDLRPYTLKVSSELPMKGKPVEGKPIEQPAEKIPVGVSKEPVEGKPIEQPPALTEAPAALPQAYLKELKVKIPVGKEAIRQAEEGKFADLPDEALVVLFQFATAQGDTDTFMKIYNTISSKRSRAVLKTVFNDMDSKGISNMMKKIEEHYFQNEKEKLAKVQYALLKKVALDKDADPLTVMTLVLQAIQEDDPNFAVYLSNYKGVEPGEGASAILLLLEAVDYVEKEPVKKIRYAIAKYILVPDQEKKEALHKVLIEHLQKKEAGSLQIASDLLKLPISPELKKEIAEVHLTEYIMRGDENSLQYVEKNVSDLDQSFLNGLAAIMPKDIETFRERIKTTSPANISGSKRVMTAIFKFHPDAQAKARAKGFLDALGKE